MLKQCRRNLFATTLLICYNEVTKHSLANRALSFLHISSAGTGDAEKVKTLWRVTELKLTRKQ
jgi:hypothetical protein